MEESNVPDISQIMQVFIAQMDSAMKVSKIVSSHSDENELSPDSVIAGLVYRLMTPMSQEEINECMGNADEILNDETSDEEYIDMEEGEIILPEEPRKVKYPKCNCEICMGVRTCLINYNSYETYEPLTTMFNDAIKKSCDGSKIYI